MNGKTEDVIYQLRCNPIFIQGTGKTEFFTFTNHEYLLLPSEHRTQLTNIFPGKNMIYTAIVTRIRLTGETKPRKLQFE